MNENQKIQSQEQTIPINPECLLWARNKAGLSLEDAVIRVNNVLGYEVFTTERLASWELGIKLPDRSQFNQLEELAKTYNKPLVTFFLSEPPLPVPKIQKPMFGQRIRELREAKFETNPAYSLRGFAYMVGLSPSYMSMLENGKIDSPGSDSIIKMAELLEVDADELFWLAEKTHPELREIIVNDKTGTIPELLRSISKLTKEQAKEVLEYATFLKETTIEEQENQEQEEEEESPCPGY